MKDSDEKEHRISNLKELINSVNKEEEIEPEEEENIPEDEELIKYLNHEDEKNNIKDLDINDDYIYHPNLDENYVNDVEDENKIDEKFILNTPKEEEFADEIDDSIDDFSDEMISENFDNLINSKIGRTPVIGIVSLLLGLLLLVISTLIFQSGTERIIDSVASGETKITTVIVLLISILLIIFGIYKIFYIKNPIDKLLKLDKEENEQKEEKKKEPEKITIPKSKIPLDKDSYKIGEFEIDDLKTKHKKPSDSESEEESSIEEDKKEKINEEIEYQKVHLDDESIDEIFADIDKINEK